MPKPAILCVDDDTVVLESLKEQLKRRFGRRYSYETAQSAAEALEILEELDNDGIPILLAISDWLMPGMKGDEFLIEVHRKFPKVIKIMLTGQADEEAIARAKEQANLHYCLRKPWDENELAESILSGLEMLDE
ncbi:response regulator [Oscillatoria sp. FACHB-1406]|uniref:response regulator n=1 Tax=Oscillatoria sp. FACHB-1406 TaxID=2692846 RepID=UPI0016889462|nr:response regulator [Oscillatoria sp. FACHB-1406]MBD2576965.1 response regulator [Oscillatoria sp. FACHB-1406]